MTGHELAHQPSAALPACPTAARFADQLTRDNLQIVAWASNWSVELVPKHELLAIVSEVDRSMAPAPTKNVQAAAAALLGAYRRSELNDPKIYIAGLLRELAAYPVDVLTEMVCRAHRRCKFCPSIAEAVEIAQEIAGERQRLSFLAKRQLAEHARRESEIPVRKVAS